MPPSVLWLCLIVVLGSVIYNVVTHRANRRRGAELPNYMIGVIQSGLALALLFVSEILNVNNLGGKLALIGAVGMLAWSIVDVVLARRRRV